MKQTILFFSAAVCAAVFSCPLFAQETGQSGDPPSAAGTKDNPGMGLLEQATEAKVQASTVMDLSQVIVLCQRAKKAGLDGENLKYCQQLQASTQLQRGLVFSQQVLTNPNPRTGEWKSIREKALADLDEAVAVISDQPAAYLRIAQLNLLPDGDKKRAKDALGKAVQAAKNDTDVQIQAVRLLASLETDLEEREKILAAEVKNGNPQILLLHAVTLLELKRTDAALETLQKLLEKESDNAELRERIVSMLMEAREFKAAETLINQFTEKGTDEQKSSMRIQKALLLSHLGKEEEAGKLLAEVLEKNPDRVEVFAGCSDVYLLLENYDQALQCVNRALELRPAFPLLMLQKFKVLVAAEKYSEAIPVIKELKTMSADENAGTLLEYQVLTAMKNYDAAVELAKKMREKEPEDQRWLSLHIAALAGQKKFTQAMELVEEQRKAEPNALNWLIVKVQLLGEQKKWDDAVQELETYLKANPDAKEINLVLIGTLFDKKDYAAAKERLKPLLAKEPKDLALLRLDSQLSIATASHAEAVKVLTDIIKADPKDSTSMNNLAWIYATCPVDSVRNAKLALELALKASELTRYRKAFILSTLAAAYAENGDFEKAKEWSKKSIDFAKKEKEKPEEAQKELMDNLQKEWNVYQQNKPYREIPEK
ncbi:MAG: tetratricopeptide repeat protein [Planctomycetaceae bacterium]|jgi:tetratricopeptide (TPR) repeat protein|nr:tetratricopeptide repeat protein [Planctomycetaceae bacterium]